MQAGEVLAADLRLEAPTPIPQRYFDEARKRGLRSAQVLSFPTAIFSGDLSQLAALNAVTAGLSVARTSADRGCTIRHAANHRQDSRPGRSLDRCAHHRATEAELGATLRIGEASFRVTEVLDYRPDQGTGIVQSRTRRLAQL